MLERELMYRSQGFSLICGMDEVGRGPLAGPVVAACVILPIEFDCAGIDDSKKLTEKQREAQFDRLQSSGARIGIGMVDSVQIDRENILQATYSAMRLALRSLSSDIDILLIDGLPIKNLSEHKQEAIVKGDSLSASIAAASIIAKVTRDRMMVEYHAQWPVYGFDGHKGYSAASHLEALRQNGPCPIHRRSFAPVRDCLNPTHRQGVLL